MKHTLNSAIKEIGTVMAEKKIMEEKVARLVAKINELDAEESSFLEAASAAEKTLNTKVVDGAQNKTENEEVTKIADGAQNKAADAEIKETETGVDNK